MASRSHVMRHDPPKPEWHYHRPGGLQRYVCAILGHVSGYFSPTPAGVCQGFGDPSGGTCKYQDICVRCGAEASQRHPNWLHKDRIRKRWWYWGTQRSADNSSPRKRKWFDHNPGEVPCDDCGEYGLPDRMWAYTGVEIFNPFARNKRINPLYCHNCAPRRQRARGEKPPPPPNRRKEAVMATRLKNAG